VLPLLRALAALPCCALAGLCLSSTLLGAGGARFLAGAIQAGGLHGLRRLRLRSAGVGAVAVAALLPALLLLPLLQDLDLSFNALAAARAEVALRVEGEGGGEGGREGEAQSGGGAAGGGDEAGGEPPSYSLRAALSAFVGRAPRLRQLDLRHTLMACAASEGEGRGGAAASGGGGGGGSGGGSGSSGGSGVWWTGGDAVGGVALVSCVGAEAHAAHVLLDAVRSGACARAAAASLAGTAGGGITAVSVAF
jgi:hypothetical protein